LSTPILKNKLHIPTIHQNIVSCPRLIQRLDSGIKEESHAIRIAKDSGVPLLSINGIETATANLQFYHQFINQSQSTRRRI
jgi:phosphotransferase system IIA component